MFSSFSSFWLLNYAFLSLAQETACSIVKSVGDDTVLHQIASEGISSLRKAKSSKNKGQNMNFNGCNEEGFEVKQGRSLSWS